MNTNTGHPVTRQGEPRHLYLASMVARLAGLPFFIAACVALYAEDESLAIFLAIVSLLLILGGAALGRRAWWHLSREEQENAREPLWVTITMETAFLAAFAALPVVMVLVDSGMGVIAIMIALCFGAGLMTAFAITRRKDGTRTDRMVRVIRALVFSALALGVPAWIITVGTQGDLGAVASAFTTLLPALLIPYGVTLAGVFLHAWNKRRTPTAS